MNTTSTQQVSNAFNSLLTNSPTTRDMILIIIGTLMALIIGKKVKSSNCRTPIGTLSMSFWSNVSRSGRDLVGRSSSKRDRDEQDEQDEQDDSKEVEIPELNLKVIREEEVPKESYNSHNETDLDEEDLEECMRRYLEHKSGMRHHKQSPLQDTLSDTKEKTKEEDHVSLLPTELL